MPDFHPSECDDQVFPELFKKKTLGRRKLTAIARALPIQVGVFVNDSPATRDEALAAFTQLGWTCPEPEDIENGIWLVWPDSHFRGALTRYGSVERHVGSCDIYAEMP